MGAATHPIRIWREALAPELALTVREWTDRHRILPPRSAEPGPVALARVVVAGTPYKIRLNELGLNGYQS
jgi:phage terminase large subunit GpA-like protein